jgi:hypothetical protein
MDYNKLLKIAADFEGLTGQQQDVTDKPIEENKPIVDSKEVLLERMSKESVDVLLARMENARAHIERAFDYLPPPSYKNPYPSHLRAALRLLSGGQEYQ